MISKYLMVNLKSGLDFMEVAEYLKVVSDKFFISNLVFFPSSIYVPYFLDKKFDVGLQNISNNVLKESTGMVNALQASSIGVKYVLLGHNDFNESDDIINQKVNIALENNFNIVLCIGESLEERQMLKTYDVLYRQIKNRLRGIDDVFFSKIFIAYEPVLSIGTNIILDNDEIYKTIDIIKGIFYKNYNSIPYILYGGSVNEENIKNLNHISNIDGFLIGSAAFKAEKLLKIIDLIDV